MLHTHDTQTHARVDGRARARVGAAHIVLSTIFDRYCTYIRRSGDGWKAGVATT